MEGVVFFAYPAFARGAKKRRNFEEKQSKNHPENATKNKRRNTSEKHHNLVKNEPKWHPKSIPEASGGLFGAKLAPRGSENRFRRPPGAQKISFGDPKRRQERFLSDFLEI